MSRATLIKIVDGGDLPCTKIGRHRRIRLGDLVDYQHRRAEVRREALDEMVAIAVDERLYEATAHSAEDIRSRQSERIARAASGVPTLRSASASWASS